MDNSLAGVAAIASNDVWAVGTQQPTNLTDPSTLVLHWDGSAWTIVPSANEDGSHLLAAAGVASNDVWATGYSDGGTLSEHWDGVSWSIVPTPNIAGGEPLFLNSVLALASNNVWTVGEFYQTRFSRSRSLTEQWNGSIWTVVRSANLGPSHNSLSSIDVTPNGTLWSVGTAYQYPKQKTLILRKLP